jgi:hypothetical protein
VPDYVEEWAVNEDSLRAVHWSRHDQPVMVF